MLKRTQSFGVIFKAWFLYKSCFSCCWRRRSITMSFIFFMLHCTVVQQKEFLQYINSLRVIHWRVDVTCSLRVAVTHMKTQPYSAHINSCTHAYEPAHPYMHARPLCEFWGVAVVTVWRGTWALVGRYSQHLYGSINQWEGCILCPREKKRGGCTGSKQTREEEGGWGAVCRLNITSSLECNTSLILFLLPLSAPWFTIALK